MITEACEKNGEGHRFGGIWGNNYGTCHHNLIAHNDSRNPRWASGCGFNDYRNNVLYNWGYQSFSSPEELKARYMILMEDLLKMIPKGLAEAVYTQSTVVEVETNGLMTYDRKVIKIALEDLRKIHESLYK